MKLKRNKVKVIVPASTSNLGPGFDTVGVAVCLSNELEVRVEKTRAGEGPSVSIVVEGEGGSTLPRDKKNIIWKNMEHLFRICKVRTDGYHFALKSRNRIPLAMGLGSSSAARLAGLLAANALCGNALSKSEILNLATAMEGHPDNVSPSLLGGLCISAVSSDGTVHTIKEKPPRELCAVICFPDFHLSTEKARAAIPRTILHKDAVYNVSRTALLVAALLKRDYAKLKVAVKDRMHQSYRKKFIPGFDRVIANGIKAGAYGVFLSGAGPAMFAFAPCSRTKAVARAMEQGFARAGRKAESRSFKFSSAGAKVL